VTGEYGPDSVQFDSLRLSVRFPGFLMHDGFIVKYNPEGNAVWAKDIGGQLPSRGYAIASDKNGNCYITGHFGSSTADGPDTAYVDNIVLSGDKGGDIFIIKIDPAGKIEWATQPSPGGGGYALCVDKMGDVIVSGVVANYNPMIFDTIAFTNGAPCGDIFLVKYNSNGRVVWAKQMGGWEYDEGRAITIDSKNNCYLTGIFSPSGHPPMFDTILVPDSDIRRYNMFVAKITDEAMSGITQREIPSQREILYPNPSSTSTTFLLNDTDTRAIQIKVFDVLGRDRSSEFSIVFFTNKITLDRQKVSSGTYCYQLQNKVVSQPFSIIGTGKFVIQ
jgi:hypothetical protein